MFVVATFYRFFRNASCKDLKIYLDDLMRRSEIFGTIVLAHEGINATVCGTREAIDLLKNFLTQDTRFAGLQYKESLSDLNPFIRQHVKIKPEIVTLGQPNVDPSGITGRHVNAREWDELLADPSVLTIDVRNEYETALGNFEGAIDPKLNTFKEFPEFVSKHLDPKVHKRIAMSCTGGIRCEKASSYMASQGFSEIYQLEGGILKYLEDTPASQSKWRGECFVFDHRVAVDHDLKPGSFSMCYSCRSPINAEDKASTHYIESASCPRCKHTLTPQRLNSKLARHKQMALARSRGSSHLGPYAMAKLDT